MFGKKGQQVTNMILEMNIVVGQMNAVQMVFSSDFLNIMLTYQDSDNDDLKFYFKYSFHIIINFIC